MAERFLPPAELSFVISLLEEGSLKLDTCQLCKDGQSQTSENGVIIS